VQGVTFAWDTICLKLSVLYVCTAHFPPLLDEKHQRDGRSGNFHPSLLPVKPLTHRTAVRGQFDRGGARCCEKFRGVGSGVGTEGMVRNRLGLVEDGWEGAKPARKCSWQGLASGCLLGTIQRQ
jgi:hypothetical protein